MTTSATREPRIDRLGHVGLFVHDIDRSVKFYHELLGLYMTDHDVDHGLYFFSARPDDEHHELLLLAGRNVPADAKLVQQVSFRCNHLSDVLAFWRRIVAVNTPILYTATHGNAVTCYFKDPDNNVVEVYWPTGLKARQGFLIPLDFTDDEDVIMAQVRDAVEKYGESGYIQPGMLEEQKV